MPPRRFAPMTTSIALLGALALSTGCESVDRMVRNSPFAEGLPEEDRVNLFPLAYFDGRGAAVLWPLADFDDQGFAIRPLVHKEGPVVSVAYPVSNWDTKSGEGWIGPYYDSGDNHGLFPVTNFGETSWIGPAWWSRDEPDEAGDAAVRSWGLFPLFGSGEFSHAGPVYWVDEDDDGDLEHAGLFPLIGRDLTPEDGRTDWALPLWFRRIEGDREHHALLPFFYKSVNAKGAHVYTLLGDRLMHGEEQGLNVYPLWWSWADADSSTKMLLPLFYDETAGTNRTLITPLGGRGWSSDGSTQFVNVLGPFFHRSQSEDQATTSFLWPIFERRTRDDSTSSRLWPLLRHTRSDSGDRSGWFGAGLGAYQSDDESSGWRLWPLASAYEGAAPDPLYELGLFEWSAREGKRQQRLFPLFSRTVREESDRLTLAAGLAHHHRSPEGTSTRVLPLFSINEGDSEVDLIEHLTLFARHRDEDRSYFQLGTCMGFSRERWETEGASGHETSVLQMFTRLDEERSPPVVPVSHPWSHTNLVERSETRLLLGTVKFANETYRAWNDDAPFTDDEQWTLHRVSTLTPEMEVGATEDLYVAARAILRDQGVEAEKPEEIQRMVRAVAASYTTNRERQRARIPLLFESHRHDDQREWDVLLGLAKGEADADSSRFRLLYALYKRETVGERTTRDLFPFVTWDSAPEETSFSFLWRVFRYENDHGRRSGHVLFFPWGG